MTNNKLSNRLPKALAVCLLVISLACNFPGLVTNSFPTPLTLTSTQTSVSKNTIISEATKTATSLSPSPTPSSSPNPSPSPSTIPVRFAVIGDFGTGDQAEAGVANLVKGWSPEFIITTGDNNYPSGAYKTIDKNIGQFYREFIFPYTGSYGEGGEINRFFPTLGNHDWQSDSAQPYLDYFTLPGNERYYDFVWGQIHFFAVDSDGDEPDGVGKNQVQGTWLKEALANSTAIWKVVYMHHPPYSSGPHGSSEWMQWPFKEWGASVVFAGHDHTYERIEVDGLTYIVNGLGGGPIYSFEHPVPGSLLRYNDDHGAMLVETGSEGMIFYFINILGETIDIIVLPP